MPNKRKTLNISGSNLWYLVGLIATDGCLSSDGRHIDITSKDREFLSLLKNSTGITNEIGSKYGLNKKISFRIQIGSKEFYNFLLSIGLTPKKSLTMGALKVQTSFYHDFFRGVIDGDGCVRRWTHPSNGREQWSIRIYSGSRKFLEYLQKESGNVLNVKGALHKETDRKWILKFGKMAAREISKQCYYNGCLGLGRKVRLAQECLGSSTGWRSSKTVFRSLA